MRVGFGYDVHRLVEGRRLILGGVEIPFRTGLLGHSDADVLCHAIGDALLGAATLGDLGKHFPDRDPQWAGISSLIILREIRKLVEGARFRIANIDSTLVLQEPKVASYVERMRANISDCLKIELDQASVKATTTEGLGFTGTGEGIAAYAMVLIEPIS